MLRQYSSEFDVEANMHAFTHLRTSFLSLSRWLSTSKAATFDVAPNVPSGNQWCQASVKDSSVGRPSSWMMMKKPAMDDVDLSQTQAQSKNCLGSMTQQLGQSESSHRECRQAGSGADQPRADFSAYTHTYCTVQCSSLREHLGGSAATSDERGRSPNTFYCSVVFCG